MTSVHRLFSLGFGMVWVCVFFNILPALQTSGVFLLIFWCFRARRIFIIYIYMYKTNIQYIECWSIGHKMFELDLFMKCLRWWMLWKSIQQLSKWLRRCCRENGFLDFFPRFILECAPPRSLRTKAVKIFPKRKQVFQPSIFQGRTVKFRGCTGWKCVFFFFCRRSLSKWHPTDIWWFGTFFLAAGALYIGRVNLWCGHPPREGL